jgi:hypothetical protein
MAAVRISSLQNDAYDVVECTAMTADEVNADVHAEAARLAKLRPNPEESRFRL